MGEGVTTTVGASLDLVLAPDDAHCPSVSLDFSGRGVLQASGETMSVRNQGRHTGIGLTHDIHRPHVSAHFAADGALT